LIAWLSIGQWAEIDILKTTPEWGFWIVFKIFTWLWSFSTALGGGRSGGPVCDKSAHRDRWK
jgi:hypothetical protein